jgi:hypothetical protein
VNDQFFFGQKLERAVPFHIDRVSEIAVICWEHGNNDTAFMVVGCFIDSIANRKLRHRELHLESSMVIVSQDWVSASHSNKLNQMDIVNDPDSPKRFGDRVSFASKISFPRLRPLSPAGSTDGRNP